MASALWIGVTWIRSQSDQPLNPLYNYQAALLFVVSWWWISNALSNLYLRPLEVAPLQQGKDLVWASWLFATGLLSFAYLTKGSLDLGRSIVLPVCAINPVLLFISRGIVRWVELQLRRRGYGQVRTVLVGAGPRAKRTWDSLRGGTIREHQVVGVLRTSQEDSTTSDWAPREVVGDLEQLPVILEGGGIDQVVFADEALDQPEILNLIAQCKTTDDVHFRIVSEDVSTVMLNRSAGIEEIDGVLVLHLGSATPHAGYRIMKRALDLIVGIAVLPFSLVACALLVPLIRFKSGASGLFWQKRIGMNGMEFRMVKLRTMRPDADEYADAPQGSGDPRVVGWLGAWLRRTSLDELPQIYNLLKGDMTLVGPRPEMPHLAKEYEPWQRRRLMVKPGVTGLWQILGRKNLPLQSNLEYDFYYIQNQSFLLDLVILIRTIPVVLFGKGAF